MLSLANVNSIISVYFESGLSEGESAPAVDRKARSAKPSMRAVGVAAALKCKLRMHRRSGCD
jgi:hypothetical protein